MIYIILSIMTPVLMGALIPVWKFGKRTLARAAYVIAAVSATCVFTALCFAKGSSFTLLTLADSVTIAYGVDRLSVIFAAVFAVSFFVVAVYAPDYIKHEGHDDRFFAFFLLSLGAMMSLSFSSNLVTMYFSFELLTLVSLPLVLHSGTKEASAAALKYLFYSIAGALMGLFGIVVLHPLTETGALGFVWGGTLLADASSAMVNIAVFLCIVGFGAKAGMYPMHGWLPSAHPVAPAPASALLSGIIAKAGVFSVMRVVFYVVGADIIRDSWVSVTWTTLAAITVVMGSMMAFREDVLKKRLAYSTVSNISYIMLGLSLLSPMGELGAVMHFIAHALAKNALFLAAGSVIYKTGKTKVSELSGIGRRMPVTMGAFTVAALSLVGIPPLLGFTSKWYLCLAGAEAGGALAVIVPTVLIISALLTAGYLLPVVINGYFPGKGGKTPAVDEAPAPMVFAAVVFALLSLLTGIFAPALADMIGAVGAVI